MGVKIKLKSDCCSFRPMILLIQIVIKSQLQKSDLKVLQVYFGGAYCTTVPYRYDRTVEGRRVDDALENIGKSRIFRLAT